ncbi:unnamed protein product [Arabis nemorensis]|uniref:Jacalin-type lectin domain-containing protein n=1 Tax=Arabis nemorensis TaxID=586526 RepID=A0A565C611_9BRAS|nr:unnamed protein product [Arabis nemorensis]
MESFIGKSAEFDFNDGRFQGISRVRIRDDGTEVLYIGVVYETADGGTQLLQRGVYNGTWEEFGFNYPDEYITSVECTYGQHLQLRQLVLVTSRGRRSRMFGSTATVDPSFKAHFGPAPPRKLGAIGGVGGQEWDDGKHDSVRKIRVGWGRIGGLAFLQSDYVDGEDHGMVTETEEEFRIAYENDHLVSVEVYRNRIGKPDGEKSSLKGHKIVGFHGRSSDKRLHSLGVRVSYPPIPHLSGTWSKVTQKGEIPKPRCSNAIAMVGNKMFSFGGQLNSGEPMDKHLYVFDDHTRIWSRSRASGDVPEFSCLGASMISVGSTLYVFGGKDHSGNYNGFHSFDTVSNEWKLLTRVGDGPRPRSFHSMAAIGGKIYVFGGLSTTGPLNTLDAYNIQTRRWRSFSAPGYPLAERERAGLEVVNGKLWVLYGFKGSELDDVHCFDPTQETWTEVQTFGEKPCARSAFASAVFRNYILVFGGETPSAPTPMELNQKVGGTFCLDTETNRWEKLDKKDSPSPRGSCASTSYSLNGHENGVLVFCGQFPTNGLTNDLFSYSPLA